MDDINLFSVLRNKEIIEILDGDKKYGTYKFSDGSSIKISMPYLSGKNLSDLSSLFGLQVSYSDNNKNISRWRYLDNLIKYCIENDKCSDLLMYLFSLTQFKKRLNRYAQEEIEIARNTIVDIVIKEINNLLSFNGHKLLFINNDYVIQSIDVKIEIDTPLIKKIDREYIRDISSRALEDINQCNYDSAITKSRTLLEEVFCFVIENKGEEPDSRGDIRQLYNEVVSLYDMHINQEMDDRIKKLLSGLYKIIDGIVEMRNSSSDAHGLGTRRMTINEYQARLFVNSAMTMADFILSVQENLE